jgi:putative acetyltransferase
MPVPAEIESSPAPELIIGSLRTAADARAFRELNEEWITTLFALEPADEAVLGDPVRAIVEPGGDVLLARFGDHVVGCVALVPVRGGLFELSKMAVAPSGRNRGVGRALLRAAVVRAAELGATKLFLGSNTKLAGAVHLYETMGFTHVPADRIGPLPYARADVFMELTLTSSS